MVDFCAVTGESVGGLPTGLVVLLESLSIGGVIDDESSNSRNGCRKKSKPYNQAIVGSFWNRRNSARFVSHDECQFDLRT